MTNTGLSKDYGKDYETSSSLANEVANSLPASSRDAAATANPYAGPEDLQLGQTMEAEKIHPVMLFGGQTTGKTVLLFSLLAYGFENTDACMRVRLGAPVHNTDTENGEKSANLAQSLFDLHLENWRESRGNEATRGGAFFVPVDVTVTLSDGTQRYQKFAFLDWTGENFLVNRSAPQSPDLPSAGRTPSKIKSIEQVGQSVLSHFSEAISVIFLAPVKSQGGPDSQAETAKRLLGGVEQYDLHRGSRARLDKLVFLLNQWDRLHKPGTQGFLSPTESLLEEELAKRYPDAWSQFKNLEGVKDQQRSKMQYSSGEHDAADRRMQYHGDPEAKEQVARYARTLWNWLFINSCGQAVFADVMPPPPPPRPAAPPPPPPPPPPSMTEVGIRWLNSL